MSEHHAARATLSRLDRLGLWLEREYHLPPQGLALYRIAFAAHLLVFVLADYWRAATWVGELPQALYYPPLGPMLLSSGLPSTMTLGLVVAALCVATLALLVGYRTTLASVSVSACMMSLDASIYAMAKIDHGRVLLVLVPLILAASRWGERWSVDARRGHRAKRGDWPMSVLALVIGFGMMSASLPKLVGGWLSWDTQAAYAKTYINALQFGRDKLLALTAISFPNRVIWELLDWFTITFELGFLFAFARRRVFNMFLIAAVGFHWGVLLTMNIRFSYQLIVYAAFLPYGAILRDARVTRAADWLTSQPWRLIGVVVALALLMQLALDRVVILGFSAPTWIIYGSAAALALGATVHGLRQRRQGQAARDTAPSADAP